MSKKGFGMLANEPFLFRSKMSNRLYATHFGGEVRLRKLTKGAKIQQW